MGFEVIKSRLYNDKPLLISVLSSYGIHSIRENRKYIQGALPDGDNRNSFSLNVTNEYLGVKIYTRNSFKGSDIIDALAFISNKDVGQVVKDLSNKTGVSLGYKIKEDRKDNLFAHLSSFTKHDRLSGKCSANTIKCESVMDMFIKSPHKVFTDEGISVDVQDKFGVCYDVLDSRIVIPIRDEFGRLITAKGRSLIWREGGHIAKYLAYFPYSAESVLFGLYENRENILAKREVIIVEAEKSVLKGVSVGVNNIVALSKKIVSEAQRKLILSLQCSMVLALDNDVSQEDVEEIARQFDEFVDVYIIKDTNKLLGKKDSPLDKGEMVWDELYEGKIKYTRGDL